jgi:hypothetical protein
VLLVAYEAFNSRDVESVLATMHPDVVWPNGMDGGHVAGRIVVEVHQGVRDRAGTVMADRVVHHVYDLRDGLIRTMEIREPTSRSREG